MVRVATLQRGFDLPAGTRERGCVPVVASYGHVGTHSVPQVRGPGVITGRSGTIGKVYYYDSDFWPLNTTLFVSEFHGNCPRFIAYLMESLHLERFVAATGVPSLNRNFVHPLEVLVPPVAEQRKIAAILSSVYNTIEATQAVIDQLQILKKALLAELVTRGIPARHTRFVMTEIGQLPEAWEVKPLADIVDVLDRRRVPLNKAQRRDSPGPFPYYGANGVVDHIGKWLFDEPLLLIAEDGGYFDEFQ